MRDEATTIKSRPLDNIMACLSKLSYRERLAVIGRIIQGKTVPN